MIQWHHREDLGMGYHGVRWGIESTGEGIVKEDSEAWSERSVELMETEKMEEKVCFEKRKKSSVGTHGL